MSSLTASATTPVSEAGTPSAARPPQKPTSVGIPVFADTSYHSDHRAPTSPIPGAVIPDARSRFPVRSWVMPRLLAFGKRDKQGAKSPIGLEPITQKLLVQRVTVPLLLTLPVVWRR